MAKREGRETRDVGRPERYAAPLHRLGEPSPPHLQAKAANLDRLRAAGLPVPAGIVVDLGDDDLDKPLDPRTRAAIDELLAQGPVIVRSALAIEDGARESGAGLGLSVGDCRTQAAVVEATRRIAAQREAPWLASSSQSSRAPAAADARDQAIIQRQVDAAELLVIAAAPRVAAAVEVYTPADDALAGLSTPRFAGPLSRWASPRRRAVEDLVAAAALALDFTDLDLEIVIDAEGRASLVQARPLTRALQPGWEAFAAAVASAGGALPQGWWRLDAEHNPAPLSPAHAWLLEWLGARRPGTPRTLAGWLYEPLDPRPPHKPAAEAPRFADPQAAIAYLRGDAIPAARRRLAAIDATLAGDRLTCAAAIEPACAAAAAMLDTYAALARVSATPREPTSRRARPLCLRDRDRFLDVLPGSWDIAAANLLELLRESEERAAVAPVRDESVFDESEPAPNESDPESEFAHDDSESESESDKFDPDDSESNFDPPKSESNFDPAESESNFDPAESDPDPDESDPNAAAWLLRELDDHLFALGLAPLRRVYLRAAEHLVDAAALAASSDVFFLRGSELAAALRGELDVAGLRRRIMARRAERARQLELRPPPQLVDGAPLPIAAYGRFRGLGLGEPRSGLVTRREDLRDLLARPPAPDAVVVVPALTAPAAVVLERLGVRALISASGGSLSHAALIVRELGISALIGCTGAAELIDGELVELDTRRGILLRTPRP